MIDYKNYEAEKTYPKLLILRDGLGTLIATICGYLIVCGVFL